LRDPVGDDAGAQGFDMVDAGAGGARHGRHGDGEDEEGDEDFDEGEAGASGAPVGAQLGRSDPSAAVLQGYTLPPLTKGD
jgi:hypothetical protein